MENFKEKYKPTRMCIACRTKTNKEELVRFIWNNTQNAENGAEKSAQNALQALLVDEEKRKAGRGYYVCKACIEKNLLSKIKLKKPKNKKV